MARNSRQAKILEIISSKAIETQDELVTELRLANFDITQATISRDIKELGLIKIATENNKYKYAVMGATAPTASSKKMSIFKECVVSIKTALNLVVVKTIGGTAGLVSNFIDSLSLNSVLGCTYGDDTVMVITTDIEDGKIVQSKLIDLLN
jgi:transcriptional regulator of arginine metabolism